MATLDSTSCKGKRKDPTQDADGAEDQCRCGLTQEELKAAGLNARYKSNSMIRATKHPGPKKAPGLFDQLNEALGISTRHNNLVVNLTQTPRKAKPINDTKFSVPKKYAAEQADLLSLPNDQGYQRYLRY